ncbi:hypothetical protein FOA52_000849 [Chlamydomonas sp. UWO 241]|nr:hypothetical protein FOA52_000849 [Chlamydomonas sp. UWO 241]
MVDLLGTSIYPPHFLQRLHAFVSKALSGNAVHVTTIGGSVTAGLCGHGDGRSWPDYLFDYLEELFPGQVSSTNGAVPGSLSSYMAACVNVHVPLVTDLVLVEYSVNDMQKTHPLFMNEYRRAFERLLRKLLEYPNSPAVVLVHSYDWNGAPRGHFWSNLEREYVEFATFYDLPSLSLKAATFRQMVAGEAGYSVTPRSDDPDGLAGESFFADKIHPDTLTGARALGELAMHLVLKAKWEAEAAAAGREPAPRPGGSLGLGEGGGDAEQGAVVDRVLLPPPMIDGNHAAPNDRCFVGVPFQAAVRWHEGFEWENDSKTKTKKWGYIGTKPGSTLAFTFSSMASSRPVALVANMLGDGSDGPVVKVSGTTLKGKWNSKRTVEKEGEEEGDGVSTDGDEVLVQIVHLKSYEGMGSATVRCASGCTCKPSFVEGHQPTVGNSQLYLHDMYVTQAEACIVELVVNKAGEAGVATKVKVSGLIVCEEAGEQESAAKNAHHIDKTNDNAMRGGGVADVRGSKANKARATAAVRDLL